MTTESANNADISDTYDYGAQAGPIGRFLWFCAGADPQLLMRSPHSERVKEVGIGGVVLATGILAFLSSWYAFFTVFGPNLGEQALPIHYASSTFFALVWALVIFNLDRFIVTSTGHGDGTSDMTFKEFVNGIPRIFMALIIGITLAAPLEMRVFQSELDAEIIKRIDNEVDINTSSLKSEFEKKRAYNEEKIGGLTQQLKDEITKISQLRAGKKEAQDLFNKEVTGQNSAGAGYGKNARYLERVLKERSADLETAEQFWPAAEKRFDSNIDRLEKENNEMLGAYLKSRESAESEARSIDGLGTRLALVHELFFWPSMFISLLLLTIETAPVFIKMMLVRGSYDYLTDNQNMMAQAGHCIEQVKIEITNKNGEVEEKFITKNYLVDGLLAYEQSKLKVERELQDHVLSRYKADTKTDIDQNPDKYINKATVDRQGE
jgi:hypothetical protein